MALQNQTTRYRALTIGQVAKQASVNIDTIRFYERKGLIAPARRLESGYRQYPLDMPMRIRFIKRAQDLGFTLKEVKDLMALQVNPKAPCMSVRTKAETKISEIETKVRDLNRMKKALKTLTQACSGKGGTIGCPILDCFEKGRGETARGEA